MTRLRLIGLSFVLLGLCACGGEEPGVLRDQHLERGRTYLEQGRYREALVEFQNATRLDPAFVDAHVQLGETYVRLNDRRNAMRAYVRAADLHLEDASLQIRAGKLLALNGLFADARQRAEAVLQRDAANIDAQLLLGNSLMGLDDLDGALARIEEAVLLDPAQGRTQANLGLLHMAKGDVDRARAAFEKAVVLDPASVGARLALAAFHLATSDIGEAERQLAHALRIDPLDETVNRSLAALYISSGRAADAELPLKRLAQGAKSVAAELALADYYIMTRRHSDARAALHHLLNARDVALVARSKLALVAYAEGRVREAHEHVDAVLDVDPDHSHALVVKGRFLLADDEVDAAFARLQRAVKADPRSAPAQYLLGTIYASRNDLESAAAAFRAVLDLNPRAAAAQLQLARLGMRQGDHDGALQLARQALAGSPHDPVARLVLVDSLMTRGDFVEAEREIKGLAARFPGVAAVHVRLGRLAVRKNDLAAARRAFERALEIEPRSLDALTGTIAIDVAEQRTAQARARVDSYVKRMPDNPALLVLAARTYIADRDYRAAEAALLRVVERQPDNLSAYTILGQLYMAENRLDAARARFEELARRQRPSVGADIVVAMILQAQNRSDEARRRYEAVLERDPDATAAANNLAWLYAEAGIELDRALKLAQSAYRRSPDDVQVRHTLGWVYYKQHLPALAVSHFAYSVEREPANPVYHYHLGLAYLEAGEHDKARASLQRALDISPGFAQAGEARTALARASI